MTESDFTKTASEILKNAGYKYNVGDYGEISLLFRSELGDMVPIMQIIKYVSGKVIFQTTIPYRIREEMRDDITELIMKLNCGLFCGSFDMDRSDGDIRFRNAFPCENVRKLDPADFVTNVDIGINMYGDFCDEIRDAYESRDICGNPSKIVGLA